MAMSKPKKSCSGGGGGMKFSNFGRPFHVFYHYAFSLSESCLRVEKNIFDAHQTTHDRRRRTTTQPHCNSSFE